MCVQYPSFVLSLNFPFDILPNSVHLPIRQLDSFGSGAILYAILSKAGTYSDGFSDIVGE